MPDISIIIPVYNSRLYIGECLASILKQRYKNYEVILVNDGSTDDSEDIIREFIAHHQLNNFLLINKPNGGVSSARNTGIKAATGTWIAFIDSDDWIEPDYLSNMIQALERTPADLCLCGFQTYDIESSEYDTWSHYSREYGTIPDHMYALTSFDYVWGRLYKKELIDTHGITFDEQIKYCEDNAFNFDYIRLCRNYICVKEVGYTYRRGHEGALSKKNVSPQMRVHFVEHMRRFCDSFSEADIICTLQQNISFSRIMWNVISTEVIMDILNKQYQTARQKIHSPLASAIVGSYKANSRKDEVLLFLWKRSFCGLVILVTAYYKNHDTIKKHKKFFKFISHK